MDSHVVASTPGTPSTAHSRFHIFVQIAMVLSVITGIEIVIVYLPFARWLILSALIILSAVKFLFVIFYFMHLRWDRLFCTVLFFIGLGLAGATALGLVALFMVGDSHPLDGGVPPF